MHMQQTLSMRMPRLPVSLERALQPAGLQRSASSNGTGYLYLQGKRGRSRVSGLSKGRRRAGREQVCGAICYRPNCAAEGSQRVVPSPRARSLREDHCERGAWDGITIPPEHANLVLPSHGHLDLCHEPSTVNVVHDNRSGLLGANHVNLQRPWPCSRGGHHREPQLLPYHAALLQCGGVDHHQAGVTAGSARDRHAKGRAWDVVLAPGNPEHVGAVGDGAKHHPHCAVTVVHYLQGPRQHCGIHLNVQWASPGALQDAQHDLAGLPNFHNGRGVQGRSSRCYTLGPLQGGLLSLFLGDSWLACPPSGSGLLGGRCGH
eukprot:RCo008631